jgi:phage major head subunit gpT-like protein
LRWLWFQWKQEGRAWNKPDIPCDRTGCELFNASTVVTIGNGQIALFWSSTWINGNSAKSIAPLLYQKTRRKKITVQQALTNEKWIDHIYPPVSQEEVKEFVSL